nr:RNA-protein complex protein Nop10 [Candidatus Njordarchaeota archaeon]
MPKLLRKCVSCGKYTLRKDICPYCKGKLAMPYPPKFSPADKYGGYRRRYKMEKAAALSNGGHAETPGK